MEPTSLTTEQLREIASDLLATLERLHAVFKECREIACEQPLDMNDPLLTELQTAGGAQYAAETSIAKAIAAGFAPTDKNRLRQN